MDNASRVSPCVNSRGPRELEIGESGRKVAKF